MPFNQVKKDSNGRTWQYCNNGNLNIAVEEVQQVKFKESCRKIRSSKFDMK